MFKDSKELPRYKEPSLLSRLKKNMAIGATLVTTAAAGWGLNSHVQSEQDDKMASIEYRAQSAKLTLPESAFDLMAPVNYKKMTKLQLTEYQYFTATCADYLSRLTHDDNLSARDLGRIDPAKRLGMMYADLATEIQKRGDELLHPKAGAFAAVEYKLLKKVQEQMKRLEPQIKAGKSSAERFDITKKLLEIATIKTQNAGAFRLPLPTRRGRSADF